ncbi:hypothetical protein QJQ45_007633 [Haematococcus lacustris]|nr:hypothetical protein QJQ45_007633 [Haematococcus lacustris]
MLRSREDGQARQPRSAYTHIVKQSCAVSVHLLQVGHYLVAGQPWLQPSQYAAVLDEAADIDEQQVAPEAGQPVTPEYASLLPFTDSYTLSADYERVSMINRLLANLWPYATQAAMRDEVLPRVKAALQDHVFKKFSFVEEVLLGNRSMRDEESWTACLQDKDFSLGSKPPRIAGIKKSVTSDNEVILEVPLVWGSNCKLDVAVILRLGPLRVFIPLELSDLHVKVESRITVKPLVEEMPCVGGVTISLLQAPHVDMSLKLSHGVDLMALPLVKEGVRWGLQRVLGPVLLYPNTLAVSLMPHFGLSPAPKGALKVQLLRGENLRADNTYVRLQVRVGRPMLSKPVNHSKDPEYGEEFALIVDDYETQSLELTVFKDNVGWNDPKLGVGTLPFADLVTSFQDDATGRFVDEYELKDFIKTPMQEVMVAVKLTRPPAEGNVLMNGAKSLGRLGSKAGSLAARTLQWGSRRGAAAQALPAEADYGCLYLKLMFLPFFQPQVDDEEEEAEQQAGRRGRRPPVPTPAVRSITHKVSDKLKGVLTVHLIRCVNLLGDNPNTYVRMLVTDEETDQVQKSQLVYSQSSPRWGDKFDFVMESDLVLGKLQIPVRDVVRNGQLQDTFTLQDAERGQIQLATLLQPRQRHRDDSSDGGEGQCSSASSSGGRVREQTALPAKGKEYPGLGYKRLRDKPPKAQQQQQQPAVAQ